MSSERTRKVRWYAVSIGSYKDRTLVFASIYASQCFDFGRSAVKCGAIEQYRIEVFDFMPSIDELAHDSIAGHIEMNEWGYTNA